METVINRQRRTTAHAGVTLIELLVAISIIGVLLGITLPALRGARRAAENHQCQVILKGIGEMNQEYLNEHKGVFQTFDFPPANGVPIEQWLLVSPAWEYSRSPDGGGFWILPSDHVDLWAWYLQNYAADDEPVNYPIRGLKMVTCPYVLNEELAQGPIYYPNATRFAGASYLESPALFTRVSAWLDGSDQPIEINAEYAPVRASDVAHPANKSFLVERRSFHSARINPIEHAGTGKFNILAVDGHVERRAAADALPGRRIKAVKAGGTDCGWNNGDAVPFLTTKNGALGRDW